METYKPRCKSEGEIQHGYNLTPPAILCYPMRNVYLSALTAPCLVVGYAIRRHRVKYSSSLREGKNKTTADEKTLEPISSK